MQELNGYIRLYRKLMRWGWYQDCVVKDLFLHLLLTASFKDFEWMGRQLEAGQLITGRKKLAEELNFSERQIRTALEKLKSTGEVTTETTNKYTIVTVVNWKDYQSNEEKPTKSLTNERPTSDQQKTNERPHRKNVKNVKNVNNSNSSAGAPPLLSEILSFISKNRLNVDGEKFFKHYTESEWKTSDGKKVTDWKKMLRVWHDKELRPVSPYPNGYSCVKKLSDD